MSEHTQTPWYCGNDGIISQAADDQLAGSFLRIITPWVESAWDDDATAIANARLIVRAVNSHADLIVALQEVIAASLKQLEGMGKGREPSPRLQEAIDTANATLARAMV
jgi:hypothetical protein